MGICRTLPVRNLFYCIPAEREIGAFLELPRLCDRYSIASRQPHTPRRAGRLTERANWFPDYAGLFLPIETRETP